MKSKNSRLLWLISYLILKIKWSKCWKVWEHKKRSHEGEKQSWSRRGTKKVSFFFMCHKDFKDLIFDLFPLFSHVLHVLSIPFSFCHLILSDSSISFIGRLLSCYIRILEGIQSRYSWMRDRFSHPMVFSMGTSRISYIIPFSGHHHHLETRGADRMNEMVPAAVTHETIIQTVWWHKEYHLLLI